VTKILDAATAIRKVSALRALCLRLPHVPTPAELARLQRFGELVAAPESASTDDIEPLAAGWRRWWYQGETSRLRAMAAHVPTGLVQSDRRLALYACAAVAACKRHKRPFSEGPAPPSRTGTGRRMAPPPGYRGVPPAC